MNDMDLPSANHAWKCTHVCTHMCGAQGRVAMTPRSGRVAAAAGKVGSARGGGEGKWGRLRLDAVVESPVQVLNGFTTSLKKSARIIYSTTSYYSESRVQVLIGLQGPSHTCPSFVHACMHTHTHIHPPTHASTHTNAQVLNGVVAGGGKLMQRALAVTHHVVPSVVKDLAANDETIDAVDDGRALAEVAPLAKGGQGERGPRGGEERLEREDSGLSSVNDRLLDKYLNVAGIHRRENASMHLCMCL